MKNNNFINLRWLILSFVILVLDLATKYLITLNFNLYESISICPFFNITYVRNTGAAFSFMADIEYAKHGFSILAVIVVLVLSVWLIKLPRSKNVLLKLSYACLIGGALGNMLDRLYRGFVVDFFDFYLYLAGADRHYPTFNIADIAVCIGAFFLILDMLFQPKNK